MLGLNGVVGSTDSRHWGHTVCPATWGAGLPLWLVPGLLSLAPQVRCWGEAEAVLIRHPVPSEVARGLRASSGLTQLSAPPLPPPLLPSTRAQQNVR